MPRFSAVKTALSVVFDFWRDVVKKIFLILFNLCFIIGPAAALQLDLSIDEEIRKNYNPSKLEQENLPPLPKTAAPSKTVTTQPKSTTPTTQAPPKTTPAIAEPAKKKVNKNLPGTTLTEDDFTAIKIKKGTKFRLKSNNLVSDYLKPGSKVSFTSLTPVYQRYVTIPAGTVFTASVVDSHLPQITGNGGLVELAIETVQFKGRTYSLHGKVTKANHKKIFINNIKGKRQYWKGVVNQVEKGHNFYKKTRQTSKKLADNPVGVIISPLPTIVGVAAYVVNFAGSPVFSIGYKGGRVSIPAGSEFEIKLLEDVHLSL